MRRIILIFLLFGYLFGFLWPALAQEPQIAMLSLMQKTLSRREAVLIFSGYIAHWPDGTPVTLVKLKSEQATLEFSKKILHVYPYQLEIALTRRLLAGNDLHVIEVNTNEEMITTVRSIKGAIGYGFITDDSALIVKVEAE